MGETVGVGVGVGVALFLVILGVILVVCWVILPFAVIGTKPLLRQILDQQQRTNAIFEHYFRPRNTQLPTS